MPTGTPARGPTVFPAMMSASIALAWARATSGDGVQKAPKHRIELVHPPQNRFGDFGRRELLVRIFSASCHRIHAADFV